ncbi:MAG: sporulation protein [Hydrogenophaga sp.]|uniref:SPOR domain-containing protein n=1 Tax=Hydrogenophaga sp. TaxID=1904254 RepID=UPI0016B28C18|nr:SPOR domain-containing protein [Hydrogenophaga sp.]NIM40053.1 sporulation protein [Hydrogenophaga sp.]NIN25249.1 sporulation protein [Hydrogenophaga sp.]NIN29816.1 sporulation protein [Hydrogenophaga sp.]NIN54288.1 sporulation protein [Hydrogenophaga sp.]NIO50701.1 sporulation protein [Hydrogenophaga sp.]
MSKKSSSSKSSSRSSLGGTLVGFIVGLLVGLAAALAVAVYVTRVPVPFVDRGLSRSAEDDAKEAERNKGWNPNRGVSGMPSAPPATPGAAPGTEGAISVPPADGRTLPPAGTAPAPSDPLGDLARSRTAQPAPASPGAAPGAAPAEAPAPGADPYTYFVQAGAFRNAPDAEAQRARLAMLGISATVDEREQAGRTLYRVRVGPFAQKALADLTIEQLQVNGVESALVRVQR